MRRSKAIVLGFGVSSLIPAVVFATLSPLTDAYDTIGMVAGIALFWFFSCVVAAILGIPAFFVLLRLNLVRWWSSLLVGFGIGAVVDRLIGSDQETLAPLLTMGVLGAVSAFTFWAFWNNAEDTTIG
jgi:hypothetical protein